MIHEARPQIQVTNVDPTVKAADCAAPGFAFPSFVGMFAASVLLVAVLLVAVLLVAPSEI